MAPTSSRPSSSSWLMRRLCGPAKEKSSLRAICRSNRSRCSARLTLGMIMCRSCRRPGSTLASARERKSACFWLLPSSTTRSPGASSSSRASTIRSVGSTTPSARWRTRSRRRCFSARRRDHCGGGFLVVVMVTPRVRCRGVTLGLGWLRINQAQALIVTVRVTI
ncbi:hypothetical protein D3C77_510520 [compost metagenome]